LQAKVTGETKVDPLVAVTLKVDVVDSPARGAGGVVGVDNVKS
jgi:hypothetical protein